MDVDRVQWKGSKGKKGSKGGKKGGFFGFPYGGGGKGNCKGKQNSKGKSKNKGKKGKSKNKGKTGKGKGGQYGDGCRICGQLGHWGNECPNKNNVNQINGDEATTGAGDGSSVAGSSSTRRTSTTSSATTTATTRPGGGVRRVKLYNVATPPQSVPEIYELNSDEEFEWSSVRMVTYDMSENDASEEGVWKEDSLFQWYDKVNHAMDRYHGEVVEVDRYHIRAVPLQDTSLVVLDSGADISLLPYEMLNRGQGQRLGRAVLEDAQGGRLQTFGRRSAQVEVADANQQTVIIEDDFIVASVQTPFDQPW